MTLLRRSTQAERRMLWEMFQKALPIIITQYSAIAMQLFDAWMLAKLGTTELAAIASSGMLILLMVTFGAGFMSAVITTVSQAFGRKNNEDVLTYGLHGILLAVCLGASFIVFYPASETLFLLCGHSGDLLKFETLYFQISLFSILPQILTVSLAYFFISIHRTWIAMLMGVSGFLANAVASYGLVFGALGFPQLGFVGAAWGTVIASSIQMVCLVLVFLRMLPKQRNQLFRFSSKKTRNLWDLGLPAAFHAAIDVLAWGVILVFFIQMFGEKDQAAAAILIRCLQTCYLPADGFASVMMSSVGHSLGANAIEEAQRKVSVALRAVITYMAGMGLLLYMARVPVIELFTTDTEVYRILMSSLVYVAVIQVFDSFNITYINALYAAGDTRWPSVVNAVLCLAIFIGGGVLVVVFFPTLGSPGIWMVAAIYIFFQGAFFWWRWHSMKWKTFLH